MPLVKDPVIGITIGLLLVFAVPTLVSGATAGVAVLIGAGALGWFGKIAWDDRMS